MNILLIGGGRQLGTYLIKNIENLKNYDLTIFNRGNNKKNFSKHKYFVGDRNKDLNIFKNSFFDLVIDTCAYDPNKDYKAFRFFSKRSKKYIMVSSSYVDLIEKKNNFNKIITDKQFKIIANYAVNKKSLEVQLKKNCKNYLISRSVPLISDIDHTGRTLKLIIYLSQFNSFTDLPENYVQINTSKFYAKKIIDNKNKNRITMRNAGAIISLKEIFNNLTINNDIFNPSNLKNHPYDDFGNFFTGFKTPKKEIFKVLRDVLSNYVIDNC